MNRLAGVFVCLCLPLQASPALGQEGAIQHVHDPAVIQAGQSCYIFSTGAGIHIRRSTDLFHWEHVGQVFEQGMPAWCKQEVPGAKDIWAPDVAFFNGRYHLYYSVSTFGSQRSCIGLATNKTLHPGGSDYKWIDQGKVIESFPGKNDFNAIDPAAMVDAKGQPWLAWGSFWSGIKLARLDAGTGKIDARAGQIRSLAARPQAHAIEAPYIVFRKGFYYLFVSFDACCKGTNSSYKIMIGRSRQLAGPYLDRDNRPMLEGGGTLLLAGHERWRGPGHNAVLQDKTEYWLVHHTYDAQHNGVPTLQIRPLLWDKDGWPLAGEPIAASVLKEAPRQKADMAGTWRHSVNYGTANDVRFLANGRIDDPNGGATWSCDGSQLRLRWPRENAPGDAWIDECFLAADGNSYIGRNQQGMVIRGVRSEPDQEK